MKFLTNNIILFISIILFNVSGFAGPKPPMPSQKAAQTRVPKPPDTPINKELTALALAGTLLGLYTIYKHKTNKKRHI